MKNYSLTELLDKAIILSTTAHKGQVDKGGNPYILHPMAVANRVPTIKHKIVAFLHDVLEDTYVTIEHLHEEGFPRYIIEAVIALTRKKGESYSDYCQRLSENELALVVKIADLEENLDRSRLSYVSNFELIQFKSLSKRYEKALETLKEILEEKKKNEFKPNYAIPPAETLKEFIREKDISLHQLSNESNVPLLQLEEILTVERGIDEITSEKLGRYLGINPHLFFQLELKYRETLNRLKKGCSCK